ncbi:hypothetical protein GCM10023186_20000 [Hymenobacter koreensis]|uniref:Uncharacterized protein n=1 Tax=Hymenobacter koreensis TaxID=1084523 RepID=A0ABP8IZP8_9BACT
MRGKGRDFRWVEAQAQGVVFEAEFHAKKLFSRLKLLFLFQPKAGVVKEGWPQAGLVEKLSADSYKPLA